MALAPLEEREMATGGQPCPEGWEVWVWLLAAVGGQGNGCNHDQ